MVVSNNPPPIQSPSELPLPLHVPWRQYREGFLLLIIKYSHNTNQLKLKEASTFNLFQSTFGDRHDTSPTIFDTFLLFGNFLTEQQSFHKSPRIQHLSPKNKWVSYIPSSIIMNMWSKKISFSCQRPMTQLPSKHFNPRRDILHLHTRHQSLVLWSHYPIALQIYKHRRS